MQSTKSKEHEEPVSKKREITEEQMRAMEKEKEEKSLEYFYELCQQEPEEESLEQKIRRNRKELDDNTFM